MLFNSVIFIVLFLPMVILDWYLLQNRRILRMPKIFPCCTSDSSFSVDHGTVWNDLAEYAAVPHLSLSRGWKIRERAIIECDVRCCGHRSAKYEDK